MNEKFDCLTCGACCYGPRDYVQVFPYDATRLGVERTAEFVAPAVGENPASVGRAAEPRRFMKMSQGHCSALCVGGAKGFSCGIYDRRPTLCRALEPGSDSCREARVQMGLDAPTQDRVA